MATLLQASVTFSSLHTIHREINNESLLYKKRGFVTWWQTLTVALTTYAVTKLVDLFTEKRDFRKRRRDLALTDIEQLKDRIGTLYELAANWKGFDQKQSCYIEAFEADHELIGRINKYPPVAQVARDTIHWCKIVAAEEKQGSNSTVEHKKELAEKYRNFLCQCDDYLSGLI